MSGVRHSMQAVVAQAALHRLYNALTAATPLEDALSMVDEDADIAAALQLADVSSGWLDCETLLRLLVQFPDVRRLDPGMFMRARLAAAAVVVHAINAIYQAAQPPVA
jgi:hypothetical protein